MAGLVGLGEVDRNAVGLARSPVAVHSGRAGLRFPGRDSPQATATLKRRRLKLKGPQAKGRRLDHPDQSWSSPDCIPGVLFESATKAISQFRFKPLKCACRQSSLRGMPSGCEAP